MSMQQKKIYYVFEHSCIYTYILIYTSNECHSKKKCQQTRFRNGILRSFLTIELMVFHFVEILRFFAKIFAINCYVAICFHFIKGLSKILNLHINHIPPLALFSLIQLMVLLNQFGKMYKKKKLSQLHKNVCVKKINVTVYKWRRIIDFLI